MLQLTLLCFSLIGSVEALAGASVLLLMQAPRARIQPALVSCPVETLLGATFTILSDVGPKRLDILGLAHSSR